MAIYLRKFETTAAYEAAKDSLIKPNVSYITEGNGVYYAPVPPPFFCKLTLNNGEVVELEGSGQLTSAITDTYKSTLVSAEIGELCTSISYGAFANCSSLTSCTIGNGVLYIDRWAFQRCTSLISINIPDSVTFIGDNVFSRCTDLTSCTIGNGVTSIDDSAFYNCTSLTSIDIPSGVTSIGDYAFEYCEGLTSCTIGSGVTSIGNNTFANCTGLTSIDIPNSVTSIGEGAFYECFYLTSLTIGSGVTSIGENAFKNCGSLTSVTIGSSVTSIGDYAFENCGSLTSITCKSTTAPTLGNDVFNDIEQFGELYVIENSTGYDAWMSELPSNWQLICPTIITYSASAKLVETTTRSDGGLHTDAFLNGYQQIPIKSHTFENGVGTIEFYGEVTEISRNAFYNSTSLTRVTIPSTITIIGVTSFGGCSNLENITCNAMTAPTIRNSTFRDVKTNGTLTVPTSSTGYDTWMQNANYYLGLYNWTKVVQ